MAVPLMFGELLRRRPFQGVKKRWHDEVEGDFMPLVLGMGDFSCARIVSNGQKCAPLLLTLLHKTEGQLLVLLTFLSA